MSFRHTESLQYRTARDVLFEDFVNLYQFGLDLLANGGEGSPSLDSMKEIEILLGHVGVGEFAKVERIFEEFQKQFEILQELAEQTDSAKDVFINFVYELPGNFRAYLKSLAIFQPDCLCNVDEYIKNSEWLQGRYKVSVEGTGQEPVPF